jgi:hypothetical protein
VRELLLLLRLQSASDDAVVWAWNMTSSRLTGRAILRVAVDDAGDALRAPATGFHRSLDASLLLGTTTSDVTRVNCSATTARMQIIDGKTVMTFIFFIVVFMVLFRVVSNCTVQNCTVSLRITYVGVLCLLTFTIYDIT